MPVRGTKPKEHHRHRNVSVHEWTEIEDVPFVGPVPVSLPADRLISDRNGASVVPLLAATSQWWAAVARMPHCSLWAESDWQFALASALVADLAFRGVTSAATELRQREKVLGTTVDSRRDLRIRYVEPGAAAKATPVPASVTNLADRRARLSDAS